MGTLLTLFTLIDDLTFTTTNEDEDGFQLSESNHTLRDGEMIRIFISEDEEEGISYVITGGLTFKEFKTKEETNSFFMDIQKKPGILYDVEPCFR